MFSSIHRCLTTSNQTAKLPESLTKSLNLQIWVKIIMMKEEIILDDHERKAREFDRANTVSTSQIKQL